MQYEPKALARESSLIYDSVTVELTVAVIGSDTMEVRLVPGPAAAVTVN
jgi:hypothetical protein